MDIQLSSAENLAKSYWKSNLLKWESFRYNKLAFFNPAAGPIRKRIRKAAEMMLAFDSENRKWIDVGCGSGILRKKLGRGLKAHYCGVDISSKGIEAAKVRFENWPNTEFHTLDITQEALPEGNGLVLLGVTDWVSKAFMAALLKETKASHLIVSFTSETPTPTGNLYGLYHRFWRRERKKDGYPIRYQDSDFLEILKKAGFEIQSVQTHGWGPGRLVLCEKKST